MRPNILKRIFWDPNRAFVGTNFHNARPACCLTDE